MSQIHAKEKPYTLNYQRAAGRNERRLSAARELRDAPPSMAALEQCPHIEGVMSVTRGGLFLSSRKNIFRSHGCSLFPSSFFCKGTLLVEMISLSRLAEVVRHKRLEIRVSFFPFFQAVGKLTCAPDCTYTFGDRKHTTLPTFPFCRKHPTLPTFPFLTPFCLPVFLCRL
jgi:hypothetical protein